MKTTLFVPLCLLIVGCANSFEKVRSAASGAPEWYGAAREEIIGEGYPNLGDAPQLSEVDVQNSAATLTMSRDDIVAARNMFATHPRFTTPVSTEIEIKALKAQLVAGVNASGPAPTGTVDDLFLTQADIDQIEAIFARAAKR